ncbi:MAG: hypothetical protein ACYC26_14655 [Phycisphaerales bacterium]
MSHEEHEDHEDFFHYSIFISCSFVPSVFVFRGKQGHERIQTAWRVMHPAAAAAGTLWISLHALVAFSWPAILIAGRLRRSDGQSRRRKTNAMLAMQAVRHCIYRVKQRYEYSIFVENRPIIPVKKTRSAADFARGLRVFPYPERWLQAKGIQPRGRAASSCGDRHMPNGAEIKPNRASEKSLNDMKCAEVSGQRESLARPVTVPDCGDASGGAERQSHGSGDGWRGVCL